MRILQLCKKFPYPANDGESIAVGNMSRGFKRLGCEVSLLTMNTTKHPVNEMEAKNSLDQYVQIHSVKVDNRVKIMDALMNFVSNDSYHVARFISDRFNQKLIKLLKENQYDIVQLETMYLAPYIDTIRAHSSAKIILRSHNVEHEIWERISQNTRNPATSWYIRLLTKQLKAYETDVLNKVDLLVAMTNRDMAKYAEMGLDVPGFVSPIGLISDEYDKAIKHQNSINSPLKVGFIGTLDWLPNLEGLEWFLENVWDSSLSDVCTFSVAGRNMPAKFQSQSYPNVQFIGEVDSAIDFMVSNEIMIVPLLSGGGMRVKILEGMALAKAMVTTSVGVEGIDVIQDRDMIIADTSDDFRNAILKLCRSESTRKQIGENARSLFEKEYDNEAIMKRLVRQYQKLLNSKDV